MALAFLKSIGDLKKQAKQSTTEDAPQLIRAEESSSKEVEAKANEQSRNISNGIGLKKPMMLKKKKPQQELNPFNVFQKEFAALKRSVGEPLNPPRPRCSSFKRAQAPPSIKAKATKTEESSVKQESINNKSKQNTNGVAELPKKGIANNKKNHQVIQSTSKSPILIRNAHPPIKTPVSEELSKQTAASKEEQAKANEPECKQNLNGFGESRLKKQAIGIRGRVFVPTKSKSSPIRRIQRPPIKAPGLKEELPKETRTDKEADKLELKQDLNGIKMAEAQVQKPIKAEEEFLKKAIVKDEKALESELSAIKFPKKRVARRQKRVERARSPSKSPKPSSRPPIRAPAKEELSQEVAASMEEEEANESDENNHLNGIGEDSTPKGRRKSRVILSATKSRPFGRRSCHTPIKAPETPVKVEEKVEAKELEPLPRHASPSKTPRQQTSLDRTMTISPFFTKAFAFSNHFKCFFYVDEKLFCCTEQFYMYYKARVFGDMQSARDIMHCQEARDMKRLGSRIRLFNTAKWRHVSILVMTIGNMAKFAQNKELRAYLFETGESMLVEASPDDIYWGVGVSVDSASIRDVKNWPGKNVLGRILTRIREVLKEKHPEEWEDVQRLRRRTI